MKYVKFLFLSDSKLKLAYADTFWLISRK